MVICTERTHAYTNTPHSIASPSQEVGHLCLLHPCLSTSPQQAFVYIERIFHKTPTLFAVSSLEQGACGASIVKSSRVKKKLMCLERIKSVFDPLTFPSQRYFRVPGYSCSSVSAAVEQQRQGQCQLAHLVPLPLVTVVTSLRISEKHTDLGSMVSFHVDSAQLVFKLISSYSTILSVTL
jgi:hypothetical protein